MSRVKHRAPPARARAPVALDDSADDSESDAEQRALHVPVDIGPAWLLLAHGAFITATSIGSSAAYQFLLTSQAQTNNATKALAIVQAVGSLLIGAWTIYAINGTWRENRKLVQPIYGNAGFLTLLLIVIYLMATAIVIIVFVAIFEVP